MPGNNNWINLNAKKGTSAFCNLDFSNLKPMPKKEAIEYNIEQITKNYNNLYVALSGDINSEFVADSLLKHGVKFTPIIIDYESNVAELWYAHRWCYVNKILPYVIKLPLSTLLEQLPAIANHFNTAYISTMEFIIERYVSRRYGHVLTGISAPFQRISVLNDKISEPLSQDLNMTSYDYGLDLAFGNKHPLSFITYTPELLYSFIRDIDYSKPAQLAISEYYDVIPRPRFDQEYNLLLNQAAFNLNKSVNNSSALYNFYMGNKDNVLEKASRNEIISCKVTLKSGKSI